MTPAKKSLEISRKGREKILGIHRDAVQELVEKAAESGMTRVSYDPNRSEFDGEEVEDIRFLLERLGYTVTVHYTSSSYRLEIDWSKPK